MATAAQVLANHANAQLSTGPSTPEGKARSSANSTKLGLFSKRDFVPEECREAYEELRDNLLQELCAKSQIEQVLAREIISASWRLERCAQIEANFDNDELETASLERARNSAAKILAKFLAELRAVQTNRRTLEEIYPDPDEYALGLASITAIQKAITVKSRMDFAEAKAEFERMLAAPLPRRAPQPQNEPNPPAAEPTQIPRTAPCPCGSGQKYKRCCGISAPPVLSHAR